MSRTGSALSEVFSADTAMLFTLLLLQVWFSLASPLVRVALRKGGKSVVDAQVDRSSYRALVQSAQRHLHGCAISDIYLFAEACHRRDLHVLCSQVKEASTDEDVALLRDGDIVEVLCEEQFLLREEFDDSWHSRWRGSRLKWWNRPATVRQSSSPQWFLDKGLATAVPGEPHHLHRNLAASPTKRKPFVVHFQAAVEQPKAGCSLGYFGVVSHACDDAPNPDFLLQFGPKVCSGANHTELLVHLGKGTAKSALHSLEVSPLRESHFYTLVLHENATFEVFVDMELKAIGTVDVSQLRKPPKFLPSGVPWVTPAVDSTAVSHMQVTVGCVAIDAFPAETGSVFFDNLLVATDVQPVRQHFLQSAETASALHVERQDYQALLRQWYDVAAPAVPNVFRARYSTVLVTSLQGSEVYLTCAAITQAGHILCNHHDALRRSGGPALFAVAINSPEATQAPVAAHLAHVIVSEVGVQLAVLHIKSPCCSSTEPARSSGKDTGVVPFHLSAAPLHSSRRGVHMCMNNAANSQPALLTTTTVYLERAAHHLWEFNPPVQCSGGVVVDSEGALLGIASLTHSSTVNTMIPVRAAVDLVALVERDVSVVELFRTR